MRILFITHAMDRTGAPMSLLALLRYFRRHTDWDMRILARRGGLIEPLFHDIAPVDAYLIPPAKAGLAGAACALQHIGIARRTATPCIQTAARLRIRCPWTQ